MTYFGQNATGNKDKNAELNSIKANLSDLICR